METFPYTPTLGAQSTVTPRVRVASFGDGYQQRVADGINTQRRIWSVTFTTDSDTLDAIEAFLSARGGVEAFAWTPPKGAAGVFICRAWPRANPDVGFGSITTTFEEMFGEV